MDIPKLTLIGRNELYIENHRGIIEFQADLLRINLSRGFIEIQGNNLKSKPSCLRNSFLIGEINTIVFRD